MRKRVQGFVSTINRVMRALGPKQEAALRNILQDVYAKHGFNQNEPATWLIDDAVGQLMSEGGDNRFYIDVPIDEKTMPRRWVLDGTGT